ncbi:MBL fold metallo-hydrolase [Flavobacteriaceae bacterium F08102]|nr:MBL fold metallo-hydrolase [Flavobacteriaceae bacterium F08102]
MKSILFLNIFLLGMFACKKEGVAPENKAALRDLPTTPYVVVLGVAQDAGYPQINCQKACCKRVYEHPALGRFVSSIAIVDPKHNQSWIFDASPDFKEQIRLLSSHLKKKSLPDGIFLTHGHIGHYTGLMELGREAMNASNMPVYAMPRMQSYLTTNGPWSQLVALKNIELRALQTTKEIQLNESIKVQPFLVPHRDEFTETVGYIITVNRRKILFIPDIDKWEKWKTPIEELIPKVDLAFLDATFYKNGEIDRDMSLVPHPFVTESMKMFSHLSSRNKAKIHLIHFNHTNPLLIENSKAQQEVKAKGFNIAVQGSYLPISLNK